MKKVIDAFMFSNELDLLEGRLNYLYDHVDYFVLVESNMTHSGQAKPMYFAENIIRYKKYIDKILYFPFLANREDFNYDKIPTWERDYKTGPWQSENSQRNHISKALNLFNDNDIIMISDVDEIPNKECINIARGYFNHGWDRLSVEQDFYSYNFRQKLVNKWIGTAITTIKVAKDLNPQGIRNTRHQFGPISNGGWHLSYWGDIQTIRYKIESFSHQELNQDRFKDPDHIKEKILSGQDMFDRNNEYVKIDPATAIPQDILEIFGSFEKRNLESINV